MQYEKLAFGHPSSNGTFRVVIKNPRAEAAVMVIAPGKAEGGPDNRHRGADQWLYVVSGRGSARVGEREYSLGAGALLLIERGETHEIRNDGNTSLETLNFYVPPAYSMSGEELPPGRD